MSFSVMPATSSGLKAADAVIVASPARLLGVQLIADGTNACNVILYDNASAASGTAIAKLSVAAASTYVDLSTPAAGILANNGIYADVTGTGAGYIVYYSLI